MTDEPAMRGGTDMEARAYWDKRNRDHISRHAVTPMEVDFVLVHARPPYPERIGDGRHLVRGRTEAGRYLQVIFVYRSIKTLDWRALGWEDRLALDVEGADEVLYPIHARELTGVEKRALRRRLK
jgi:hypothetical protein